MAGDPLPPIVDAPLFIVPRVLEGLRAYRTAQKNVSGPDAARLRAAIDGLAERLLAGVEAHPTRFWVLTQCRKTLDSLGAAEPAARQQLRIELEKLMEILGVANADAALGFT